MPLKVCVRRTLMRFLGVRSTPWLVRWNVLFFLYRVPYPFA